MWAWVGQAWWWVASLLLITTAASQNPINDFRLVPYEALLSNLDQFSETGVSHFSEILFDVARYQLIVGARDALFRLSLDGLTKLGGTEWSASNSTKGLCTAKGQTEESCRNYIKVLVLHQDQVFVCGTHAFTPKCSWRDIQELGKVTKWIDGRAKCPYSPLDNSTALMSSGGDYYIGSATDFSSSDHAIYRMSGHNLNLKTLRTVQYNSMWLSQPNFVGSFETKDFVYFLFRETAVEYINCGKAIFSRIARVCKRDTGGSQVLKDNWTTFLKARLNCSIPGNYPFYYDQIQSVDYLADQQMVYTTFTTGENSIAGSAICNFNLSSVEATFNGPFKYQARPDSTWGPQSAKTDHFQCKEKATSEELLISRKYQLMDTSVQPAMHGPIYTEHLTRLHHIVVDSVNTKHQDRDPIHVIFVSTEEGSIKKLSYNPKTQQTCLVEILHPFPKDRQITIRKMKMLGNTNSLYIATDEKIIRLPVQRCSRFTTKKQCLNAMDPYCGWNRNKEECVTAPNKNPRVVYWQQSEIQCPITTDPVDGSWGSWSHAFQCSYTNPDKRVDSSGDYCMCKRRACDSPKPLNGGANCEGTSLVVTNCTQHGQWTRWSEWSGCSLTCGVGLKTRQRYCGNPEPAYGGRVCVGRDVDEQYCDQLPPCPGHGSTEVVLYQKQSSSWSDWSEWTTCSSRCGPGWRSRARKCYGDRCEGCGKDWEECNSATCSDYVDVTDWTPWVNTSTDARGWYEKRFTFSYRAPISINKAGRIGEEERYCYGAGRCTTTGGRAGGEPEDFTEWSTCSKECGSGKQFKMQVCSDKSSCMGSSMLEQACNTQPCAAQWACWAEWTTCAKGGTKKRTRECEGGAGACGAGSGLEEKSCDGWPAWTVWSQCRKGKQTRERADKGDGVTEETRQCSKDDVLVETVESMNVNLLVGAAVSGFLVGAVMAAMLVYYYFKYKQPGVTVPPHYISAKSQNLYVSLPMLDLKHKQIPSNQSDYGGTLRSNGTGTLRSKSGGSSVFSGGSKQPDYETATIKRSHSRRDSSLVSGGIRADLDSDQLFT